MFVRTKNGIYDFEEQKGNIENRGKKSFLAISNDYRGFTCYDYEEIIQEADTIPELCDEFVVIEKDNNQHKVFNKKGSDVFFVKDEHIDYFIKYYDFYGAIWTDKGLIYVAKMNENGELELI